MEKSRFIFYNPHASVHFGAETFYILTRRKSANKYNYLIKYLIKNEGKVYVYLDRTSFIFKKMDNIFGKLLYIFEFYFWCICNKYNPFKFRIILNKDKIKKEDKLFLFIFPFLQEMYDKKVESILSLENTKFIHTTHYFSEIETVAKNIKNAKNYYYIGENNLSKNSNFFNKYLNYSNKKKFITLPFIFQDRFKKIIKYDSRIKYCVATGTLFIIDKEDSGKLQSMINYFGVNVLHPMRKELYENKEYFKDLITILISNYYDKKPEKIIKKDNIFIKLYKGFKYAFFSKQVKYFKFNIVTTFNEYKLFIVPEEIIGLPGISFVEGMACGCVYVGKKDNMYQDLGMISGKHYIGYDGTKEDLKKVLEFYKKHPEKLNEIAKKGYNFARKKFNSENVAKKFFKEIKKL